MACFVVSAQHFCDIVLFLFHIDNHILLVDVIGLFVSN